MNQSVVDTLSADDIFMGEMSFLLNNRRTATVRATTDGTLIRISKKGFVDAVKAKPQYAPLSRPPFGATTGTPQCREGG